MSNTVSILSYANTFGDWVINTNEAAIEINTLGKGTYTKDTGILVLNGAGTGLQVSNNSLFTGIVSITGTGQALQVTHDAIIGGDLTVSGNTNITLNEIVVGDVSSNTIHSKKATIGKISLGDTTITGNLTISGNNNVNLNEVVTGNLTVSGTVQGKAFQDLANNILSSALALSVALG